MKVFFGSPGKMSGLLLRIGQCSFAAASFGVMVSAHGFYSSTAFCSSALLCFLAIYIMIHGNRHVYVLIILTYNFEFNYLIASMGLEFLWSFGLTCLDFHAVRSQKSLQNPVLMSLFVVGDWVTATLSLAGACSSAGVVVLYSRDLDYCGKMLPCTRFQIGVAFAFISWFFLALSSLVMLWLLGSL